MTHTALAAVRAVPLLEETLAIDRAAGTVVQTAQHLYHYGVALTAAGRASEVERPLLDGLPVSIELGHVAGTAYLEQALADVAIRTGRLSMAAVRLDRARAGHERIGGGDGLAEALRSAGDLAAAGEPDTAAACGRECRAILADMSLDKACLYLPPVY